MLKKTSPTLLFRDFPRVIGPSFNQKSYQDHFSDHSFIVLAKGNKIEYGSHWGVLSIKCAFNGTEYYESGNGFYAVQDSNFLIFNEGTTRSSYISSKESVESFSISFSPRLLKGFLHGLVSSAERILDDPFYAGSERLEFTEKLYPHDNTVSPILYKIKHLAEDWDAHRGEIEEALLFLMESLVKKQKEVWWLMSKVDYARISTQKELYKRLNRARDYIFSCFRDDLTNEEIAGVACLNQYYFLREFKKMFQYTPHQYLQSLRLQEAQQLLAGTDKMVAEICYEVGYADLASFSKLFKKHYKYSPSERRLKSPTSLPKVIDTSFHRRKM